MNFFNRPNHDLSYHIKKHNIFCQNNVAFLLDHGSIGKNTINIDSSWSGMLDLEHLNVVARSGTTIEKLTKFQ